MVRTEGYNLLVTFHSNQAGLAEREIRKRIEEAGWSVSDIQRSSVDGVFCIKLDGDAKELVSSLRREFQDSPDMLTHTYHWVPIDTWVEADEDVMVNTVKEIANGIGQDESWMMHMHKRHHEKHSEDLILTLTEPIRKGKVDLRHPQKIIAVEVLGGTAGISLLESGEMIDVNRMRQEIGLTKII